MTYLLGGKFYRAIGWQALRYCGLCHPQEEGVYWCHGWFGKSVAALRVAHALRAFEVPCDTLAM